MAVTYLKSYIMFSSSPKVITWKRLQSIRIVLLILSRRHLEYIPLHRQIELG